MGVMVRHETDSEAVCLAAIIAGSGVGSTTTAGELGSGVGPADTIASNFDGLTRMNISCAKVGFLYTTGENIYVTSSLITTPCSFRTFDTASLTVFFQVS